MEKIKFKKLHNPLPLVFLAFIISSIFYETFSKNKLLAIFIASSFFLLLYLYKKLLMTFFIGVFFIIAIINNIWYFSYSPSKVEEVRIEKVYSYSILGSINGRKVNLILNEGEVREGNKIIVKGTFNKKANITKGIIGNYTVEDFSLIKQDFISEIRRYREEIYELISDKLGRRKAGLITSVAFGYSKGLSGEDREDMKNLGISHAVAISGLHMALIYATVSKLFGKKVGLIITFFFVLFTGAAPSAVRAFVMILLISFAPIVKRNYNSISALSAAGIILLLIKPYEIFSVGFILSFLATIGIILHNKKINNIFYRLPSYLRGVASLSLAAQIYTFPVIVYYYNEFSLNFLIGNLIILPFLNLIVIIGNTLLLFMKIPMVFNFILYICYYIIKIIDKISLTMNNIKFEVIYLNTSIAGFYISLLITYYFYKKGFKRFIFFPLVTAVYFIILIYSPFPTIKYYKEGALEIIYKGDKVVLQTSNNLNKEKIIKITNCNKIYSEIDNIKIGSKVTINKWGKNYLINIDKKVYLVKVNLGQREGIYDIIDFRESNISEVWIINNEVIPR